MITFFSSPYRFIDFSYPFIASAPVLSCTFTSCPLLFPWCINIVIIVSCVSHASHNNILSASLHTLTHHLFRSLYPALGRKENTTDPCTVFSTIRGTRNERCNSHSLVFPFILQDYCNYAMIFLHVDSGMDFNQAGDVWSLLFLLLFSVGRHCLLCCVTQMLDLLSLRVSTSFRYKECSHALCVVDVFFCSRRLFVVWRSHHSVTQWCCMLFIHLAVHHLLYTRCCHDDHGIVFISFSPFPSLSWRQLN